MADIDWAAISKATGDRIVIEIRAIAGDAWDSWSADERALVVACAQDAAKVSAKAIAGFDVANDLKQINAQMAGIKVAAMSTAADVLWIALERVVKIAASAFIR
jgi:hypothetical protein